MADTTKQQHWGSRLGVILAVAGSAVGLGNYLRFPGQAVQYGGGAFMIPYLCALVFLAMPICWAEWTMGRYGGRKGFHSGPAIMGVIGRGRWARYVGVLSVLIPIVIYMYYVYIESWCLRYAWGYVTGSIDLGTDPATQTARAGAVFQTWTGIGADGSIFTSEGWPALLFFAVVIAMNIALVYRGLSGGIEKFCTWAMPTMAIISVIVLIRVLTLEPHDGRGVLDGLGFMWNPKWEALRQPEAWLAAAGQIFFSLSVGFGVILNYSSYLRKKDDVVLSGLTASATNELFEVGFGGLITVTSAFVFLGASGAMGGTFGLGFNTLPVVFAQMGGLGRLIGALWFFLLFLAAITSSISMLQPAMTFFEEALGVTRRRATTIATALGLGGSAFVVYFSKDLMAVDTMDFWIGNVAVFVLATVQIISYGWIFGIDRGWKEAHDGSLLRIPRVFRFITRYVAPIYLLTVFVLFCRDNLGARLDALSGSRSAVLSMVVVGATLVILVGLIAVGERRWRAAGLDLDGRDPAAD